jgi:hypothetical protein
MGGVYGALRRPISPARVRTRVVADASLVRASQREAPMKAVLQRQYGQPEDVLEVGEAPR